jgi:hypothetical protein
MAAEVGVEVEREAAAPAVAMGAAMAAAAQVEGTLGAEAASLGNLRVQLAGNPAVAVRAVAEMAEGPLAEQMVEVATEEVTAEAGGEEEKVAATEEETVEVMVVAPGAVAMGAALGVGSAAASVVEMAVELAVEGSEAVEKGSVAGAEEM